MTKHPAMTPHWTGIAPAHTRLAASGPTLWHAGPPLAPDAPLPRTILNAASVACVFEGWATDFSAAAALITGGGVTLRPAQDCGLVLPLADVLSPSMAVLMVTFGAATIHAPVHGGMGDALRFGRCTAGVLDHLRAVNGPLAATLAASFRAPVPLLPHAAASWAAGEDLHGRTAAASRSLARSLGIPALGDNEGFFLTLWMAACKAMLAESEQSESGLDDTITAIGGNGQSVGIQVRGLPGRWFTAPAPLPRDRTSPMPGTTVAAAVGDSMVVEAMGFGAMAINQPQPPAACLFRRRIDGFPPPVPRGLLSARAAAACAVPPAVNLGLLDAAGRHGFLGRGLFPLPQDLFRAAVAVLERSKPQSRTQQGR